MAGKSFQDRELAAKVRTLALERSYEILEKKKPKELYEGLLLRFASTILPRLNEVSGPDGEPIPILNVLPVNPSDAKNTGA